LHAGLSCSSQAQRSLLIVLLLTLLASPVLAAGADLDVRAGLLAQRLERELEGLQQQTAEFADLEVLRRQEHWYRPWQENAIVAAMDQALDASDDLLLTELLDPRGQLVAVNAHAGSGAPLESAGLYIEDFANRPWFRALTQTEQEPVQRLDGPLRDPDVVRVYGEAFSPCLRVTVALRSRGELVALLSHCYRSDALAQLLDIALRDGEERLPGELALFDGRGRLIAGRDPLGGDGGAYTSRAFPLSFADGSSWTLRAFHPEGRSAMDALIALLPPVGLLPSLAFALSACLIAGLLMLVRLRRPAAPVERPAIPSRPAAELPPPVTPRPLMPAQKAWEILNAALGAMLATLHTLADGSEELADGSLNPLVAEGPGSTLGALRRVAGMKELFGGLNRHVASCAVAGSVSGELRQGVEIFGRIGGQLEKLVDPLLETERRLRLMPRNNLRGPGEKHSYDELTGNLHALVGVMSALQSGLGRLPQRALRDEWAASDPTLRTWQESLSELQDLMLLLAGQVGATSKLLDLLPVSTDSVVEVEDISAMVMGAAASAQSDRPAAREASASAGGRSFEILGAGIETKKRVSPVRVDPGSTRLPSR
jgi:hypothetical protein